VNYAIDGIFLRVQMLRCRNAVALAILHCCIAALTCWY